MHIRSAALLGAVATIALVAPLFVPLAPFGSTGYADARAQETQADPAFFEDLAPYGVWFQHPVYGAVWQPAEIDGRWRPYQNGHWIYTRQWGWYFEASKPWGDIVFHYGRWSFDGDNGWIWIPDTEWGPGWVSWRHGRRSVGWAPISPRGEEADDPSYWSFVAEEDLVSTRVVDIGDVVYERPQVREVWVETEVLGRPERGRPANLYFDPIVIERETRVVVRPQVVEYRVALDRRGQPIGWNASLLGGAVKIGFQPARARWDEAPSPFVTQRLLIDIRSGRLREDDPYARSQVVTYAQRGQFQFQDQQQQSLVTQLPARQPAGTTVVNNVVNNVTVNVNNQASINVFNAVKTQNIAVAGKQLPPPVAAAPRQAKFRNPDELTAKPEAIGIPAVNTQLPQESRIPATIKANGLVDTQPNGAITPPPGGQPQTEPNGQPTQPGTTVIVPGALPKQGRLPQTQQPLTGQQPVTGQPVTGQPTPPPANGKPLPTQPLTTQPLGTQPLSTQQPGAKVPGGQQPLSKTVPTTTPTQPLTGQQPVTGQPVTGQPTPPPANGKPLPTQPLTTQPLGTQPLSTQQPGAKVPGGQQPLSKTVPPTAPTLQPQKQPSGQDPATVPSNTGVPPKNGLKPLDHKPLTGQQQPTLVKPAAPLATEPTDAPAPTTIKPVTPPPGPAKGTLKPLDTTKAPGTEKPLKSQQPPALETHKPSVTPPNEPVVPKVDNVPKTEAPTLHKPAAVPKAIEPNASAPKQSEPTQHTPPAGAETEKPKPHGTNCDPQVDPKHCKP